MLACCSRGNDVSVSRGRRRRFSSGWAVHFKVFWGAIAWQRRDSRQAEARIECNASRWRSWRCWRLLKTKVACFRSGEARNWAQNWFWKENRSRAVVPGGRRRRSKRRWHSVGRLGCVDLSGRGIVLQGQGAGWRCGLGKKVGRHHGRIVGMGSVVVEGRGTAFVERLGAFIEGLVPLGKAATTVMGGRSAEGGAQSDGTGRFLHRIDARRGSGEARRESCLVSSVNGSYLGKPRAAFAMINPGVARDSTTTNDTIVIGHLIRFRGRRWQRAQVEARVRPALGSGGGEAEPLRVARLGRLRHGGGAQRQNKATKRKKEG